MSSRATQIATRCALACGLLANTVVLRAQQATQCEPANQAVLIERVQDRETRIPLAGATLTASWPNAADHAVRVVTDSLGRAVICAPPERRITLRATFHDLSASSEIAVLTMAQPTSHTFFLDVPTAYVRGTVVDQLTGAAVANAAIRLANTPLAAVSDNQGRFVFNRVPLGDYALQAEHISYADNRSPIKVGGEDLDAVIHLAPVGLPLDPIVVTSFSRHLEQVGFYEREKRGVGTFLGRRQVDAMHAQSASDLLNRVPGLRLTPQLARRNSPRNTTTSRGNCRYKFIIDGSRTLPDFEMDFLSVGSIEGVEIYNGLAEVPALFRGVATTNDTGVTCGIIAVWTRDGR